MNKKLVMTAIIAVFALSAGIFVLADADESDAATDLLWTVNVPQDYQFDDSRATTASLASGSLPTGISIVREGTSSPNYTFYLRGTPTITGVFNFSITATGPAHYSVNHSFTITVQNPAPVYHNVTYNGNGGLVSGLASWTTPVIAGGHPPTVGATFSDGSQTLAGWATTPSAATPNVNFLTYIVNAPVTFYAVWEQSSTWMSSWTPTINHGQSFTNTFTTDPANATISVVSAPAGWGVAVSGKTLTGTVADGSLPGKYIITLTASASGWKTTTYNIQATVPVYVVPPIEKTQTVGTTFSWAPVTNPTNATITLNNVKLDGTLLPSSGFSVASRTITGLLAQVGTYDITYTVSATGYTSTTYHILVASTPVPDTFSPPSIASIVASQRAGEPRTWDFVSVNAANWMSIAWSTGSTVFQTASTTAIYEFPTSGIKTVTCTLTGFDGSTTAVATSTIAVTDTYHPELAWVDVPYAVVVSGTPAVDMGTTIWATNTTQAVAGTTYTIVSGTPTSAHVGNVYTFSIGSTNYSVTVYPAQAVAPVASFDAVVETDGFTTTVTFTGSNASVVYYDYGDGSAPTTSTTHVYSLRGVYVIRATAVNNISERTAAQVVSIDGGGDPISSISIINLTDITRKQGERITVQITLATGETLQLLGTASEFLEVVGGSTIFGETADVELGEYDLTVTSYAASVPTATKTIKVTIIAPEDPDEDDELPAYLWYIIGGIVFLLFLYVIVKVLKSGNKPSKKPGKKGGKKG